MDARVPPVLRVRNLRAYYQMRFFGIEREVRAVDDITLDINKNEIYGLAGESSSGKTSFIKAVAAANRPPLNVIGGSVAYSFLDRDIHRLDEAALGAVRWRHISYIMQGSMNVLNPVRRVRSTFLDFAYPHLGKPMAEFGRIVEGHLRPAAPAARRPRCLPARAFGRHAPARRDRPSDDLPARVHHRRRADDGARRRGAEGRARR